MRPLTGEPGRVSFRQHQSELLLPERPRHAPHAKVCGDVHEVVKEHAKSLRAVEPEFAGLTTDRLAAHRRLPVPGHQAIEPTARHLGAPPQACARAHEVMHVVQWHLNTPKTLEVE